ncbi:polysaccharide deacetylase family protein [Candidatus Woesearchaeota archaeon]|jgi:alpha-amylase|nr:polysaccharide deacetylase family protein [Candidatus Woesearchaeota archaeon]MBT3538328.1 polysaccharide deacetylase family protein [Candidatus Woesearchaeota archaeon]MBT4698305.1 polysaccharide deacetylase family protein [Candidatus Woesearchaeota archaeon]MBT4716796.1 polysaccharide deacetylase family protein [Candidatus Woesearchaeota archaeon]MBT7105997.1 polysaccharide deacetylase family protein [Candidatus Woesearchaeota archaeon]
MVSICFYFQVHQPMRLRNYTIFDIGKKEDYFDDEKNLEICRKITRKCYLPMNKLLLDLINKYNGKFKISFSISGVALEQFETYAPEVLESFKALAKTGQVEFLSETYYHSLSYLYSKDEFKEQVEMHKKKIKKLFKQTPKVFRNTELIYNNEMANYVEKLGYTGILAEGWDKILGWRSPNFLYKPKGTKNMKVMLKNYRLSDDIAFRFSNKGWNEWPLSVDKFSKWLNAANGDGNLVNLFMDYETFGEHQWEDTGIFNFMQQLPEELLSHKDNEFVTVSEALKKYDTVGELDCHQMLSWADLERDLSAWLGNRMQQDSIKRLYDLEKDVKATKDKELIEKWRKLTTSDHFYYMCVKYFSDGDVHKYFSPYDNPYDSFIIFSNVMNDLIIRVKELNKPKKRSKDVATTAITEQTRT